MHCYPEYIESNEGWIGKVPITWKRSRFKFLVTEKPKKSNMQLQCGSISFGKVVFKKSNKLTEETKLAYQEVLTGEFLINPLNLNYDLKSLRTALSDKDVIVSSGYIVLNSNEKTVHSYLKWLLYTFDIRHMKTLGAGIRQTITSKDIGNCYAYIPTIAEQTCIGDFLETETTRIDHLISEKENFIKLLQEKRQALISHSVTKGLNNNVKMKDSGVDYLEYVPEHWVVKKIKFNVIKIEQGWSPQCESYPVSDDISWGVVKVGCVNKGVFNPLQNKKLPDELEAKPQFAIKKDELLVSRANAKEWVGSAAVPQQDYPNLILCDKIYRIKLNKKIADPNFIAYFLGTERARQQIEIDASGTSSSMLNIGQGTILNMEIAQPNLEEQQYIVESLRIRTKKIESLVKEANKSIELLKEHRIALISEAVTGKIDVREEL
ncbi:restriction endonuclease subunit S [Pseudoalteromonas sp. NSLLW218]|uniref:restriction endonuclease subunit S n=1 Tax=Pseudoalteromonas sp. NSLLW218 TaxID=2792048 RepID=UPI0018CD5468|nr:restriction endonuclease subunit S [Pseudoalteromonas sp. NSLLW218]MBH0090415.1 restriction endonuclease subunit S [Pseudoalteromonas sp. NSLLW218]